METITNAANTAATTASKMIWGDQTQQSGTEPVSGETGKGTAGDPFDGGNKDEALESRPSGTTAPADLNPAASGARTEQKQQGADRPSDKPDDTNLDALNKKRDEGEEAMKKRDPNDHSGEPMKMHDSNNGSSGSDENNSTAKQEADRKASHPGQEGGGTHGKEEGTGEQWVKSTGLHADGGDFDVTKPGAGREADRILEQKGVKRGEDSTVPAPPSGNDSGSGEKGSKMDKIKEKLHIGKH